MSKKPTTRKVAKKSEIYTLDKIKDKCKGYVITEGNKIGQPLFNYDGNKDIEYTDDSMLELVCNYCGAIVHATVGRHLANQGAGYADQHKWSKERIKNHVKKEVMGQFKYILDKGEDKDKSMQMLCLKCNCITRIGIIDHAVKEKGCAVCDEELISEYNLGIFLYLAKKKHGNKFDYFMVTEEHFVEDGIRKRIDKTKIPITCTVCPVKWSWECTINEHLNGGTGCPYCGGGVKYNAKILRIKTEHVHGLLYDVSHVTDDDIKEHGYKTKITPFCNTCEEYFPSPVSINDFINHDSKCQECSERVPYDMVRLIKRSAEVHGEGMYDFSNSIIINNKIPIEIVCERCWTSFNVRICNHINGASGCPECNKSCSTAERNMKRILDELGIEYKFQYKLSHIYDIRNKPFDFYFIYKGYKIILEIDGQQHFLLVPLFHGDNVELFRKHQATDIKKFICAIKNKYIVLRIDHTEFKNLEKCLKKLLKEVVKCKGNIKYKFSNDHMYEYLMDGIQL